MSAEQAKKLKFLGLGSMVDVEDIDRLPDTKYVVIARAVGKDKAGAPLLRYRLAPHPGGSTPGNQDDILTVNEDQITQIYAEGYHDQADDAFLNNLLQLMNKATKDAPPQQTAKPAQTTSAQPVTPAVTPTPQPTPEQPNEDETQLQADPFYKFRKK